VLYSRVRSFRGFQDMFFQSLTPHIFWYSFVKANFQARLRASIGLDPVAAWHDMTPWLAPSCARRHRATWGPAQRAQSRGRPCQLSSTLAPTEGLGDPQVLRNLITQKQNKPFKTTIKTMVRAPDATRARAWRGTSTAPASVHALPSGCSPAHGLPRAARLCCACRLARQPPGAPSGRRR
jgi:hypothetical protein